MTIKDYVSPYAAVSEVQEKWKLVPAFLESRGLVKQHLDSFNYLLTQGLQKIIKANARTDVDQNFFWNYDNIYVDPPDVEYGMRSEAITPHECRLRDMTYSAPIKVDVTYVRDNQIRKARGLVIGRMPIMLRSARCVLAGMSQEQFFKAKECPLDPGGYFIVKGAEKVLLMQEQAVSNRILVEKDKTGMFCAVVKSKSDTANTQTNLIQSKNKIYVKQNKLREPVNVVVLFKALGIERDQEIAELIATEDSTLALLAPSLFECQQLEIFSQNQAMKYLEKTIMRIQNPIVSRSQMQSRFQTRTPRNREQEVHVWLCNTLLVNVPCKDFNLYEKAVFLGLMCRRLLQAQQGMIKADDRDYYGNKRIQLAGDLISLLFEEHFKNFNDELKLGTMTRIKGHFEKTMKVTGPRALQGSQWGMLCPSDTPEGAQCGLVKNMALMSHVTTFEDDKPIHRLLINLGVEETSTLSGYDLHGANYLVFLNGALVGATRNPKSLTRTVQLIRRAGRLPEFVSVYVSEEHRAVYLASDGGRLTRPCIIVENGRPKVTQKHINALLEGKVKFPDFVKNGLIEYLDVNEENSALIAVYERDITEQHTHLEIEPFALLGVCAGLIPYPDHNQSPRNTYQCAMGKQAMGTIAMNQRERIDSCLYNLVYPQRPLVKTRTIELIGFEQLPAGQNATVAVMSYSGYDIEDALILNKASVDRGYGRCLVYRNEKTQLKRQGGLVETIEERIDGPALDAQSGEKIRADECLDMDGIVAPGERVKEYHKLINKVVSKVVAGEGNLPQDEPRAIRAPTMAKSQPIHIERVMISEDATWRMVKLSYRQTRRPELGDKFSSRHGQKGVTGLIVPQENMPFNEIGMCPDVIMNPHGYPSRMTVGKLMECIGSKAGALSGKFHYGTAFGGNTTEEMAQTMLDYGFNYYGKDLLMSGETGEPLEAYIFMGPIYYQKLRHMVMDKMHARATGKVHNLTRQPLEGRAKDGGLRLGEMERDALLAYGASNLLNERFFYSSDKYRVEICGDCGLHGYSGWCRVCRTGEHMASINMPYACKLLLQELFSMNIMPRIQLKSQL
ncbi:Oidioi.mRNA.OKI2018_I69.chr2.g7269.t1.cds [Oikopleura dioica]|uniref:DNA-directed RNA polymerase subunit beta n=1 Tax=Oikopleura dioica TaxID=34765 RepID=A0ABN7T692_OIKDI|nr:Oidioi.mRNA.OKI2018_I69.chr2.g7269.t1.cds [Oikopleura dioica]